MSKIYIIRHGQTVWNVEGKFQGWQNSNLTKKGLEQAMQIGKFLQDKSIQRIYCSPLQRAKDTFTIIRSQNPELINIDVKYYDSLKECNYGDMEGQDENLIRTRLLLEGIDRRDPFTKFNFHFQNGESYKDQIVRVMNFIVDTNVLNTFQNTAIVCHLGTLKFLHILLQGKVHIDEIYEAVMWRPNQSVIVVFDTETRTAEVIDMDNEINS
jgi:broad specificity phosphatase PhoE